MRYSQNFISCPIRGRSWLPLFLSLSRPPHFIWVFVIFSLIESLQMVDLLSIIIDQRVYPREGIYQLGILIRQRVSLSDPPSPIWVTQCSFCGRLKPLRVLFVRQVLHDRVNMRIISSGILLWFCIHNGVLFVDLNHLVQAFQFAHSLWSWCFSFFCCGAKQGLSYG